MEKIINTTSHTSLGAAATSERELTETELDAVRGGWFTFHATTDAIDAVAKALATMAQKQ